MAHPSEQHPRELYMSVYVRLCMFMSGHIGLCLFMVVYDCLFVACSPVLAKLAIQKQFLGHFGAWEVPPPFLAPKSAFLIGFVICSSVLTKQACKNQHVVVCGLCWLCLCTSAHGFLCLLMSVYVCICLYMSVYVCICFYMPVYVCLCLLIYRRLLMSGYVW